MFKLRKIIHEWSYEEIRGRLNDKLFVEGTMSKWGDFNTFDEEMRKMGL